MLISHFNPNYFSDYERTPTVAGKSCKDISNLLASHPNIHGVILDTCNATRIETLEEEKKLVQAFQDKVGKQRCGLALITTEADPLTYENILKKASLTSCYLLSEKPHATLTYIKRKKDGTITQKKRILDQTDLQMLQNELVKGGKNFSFSSQDGIVYMRGGIGARTMTFLEKLKLDQVRDHAFKYEKSHPKYKIYKQMLPFLRSFHITKNEYDKIKSSFLKSLIIAIENNPNIHHNIDIKAYASAINVDTKENRILSVDTPLFTPHYTHSTDVMFGKGDNIIGQNSRPNKKKSSGKWKIPRVLKLKA